MHFLNIYDFLVLYFNLYLNSPEKLIKCPKKTFDFHHFISFLKFWTSSVFLFIVNFIFIIHTKGGTKIIIIWQFSPKKHD